MDLNNTVQIYQNDPGKMLEAVGRFPEQCEEAWAIARQAQVAIDAKGITSVVVTGLGGSAIGGDLLRVYVADKAELPVLVNRDYILPKFVGSQTLVIATSFSGNTEETISAYRQAVQAGARIIVITGGGKLKDLAVQDGVPVVTVPGGIQPRAATGYLFIPALVILQRLGLIPDVSREIQDLISNLKILRGQFKPEQPINENPAKEIAGRLQNRIPVIYGVTGNTEVAATRWKGQINENSKSAAYWNVFPELNHNEIVGFEFPSGLLKQMAVVILRDQQDHTRVQKRVEITKEIIKQAAGDIIEVNSTGNSSLARTFSLTYTGDYVSVYLAALYGIDPTPVKMIDYLKNKLADE
ncbi:MAG: bifunctional phosphoglucose/phosphomannose isomerase [Desulfitobacterium hafniense]|nr:bifunctional phosphoglucose/phosphomannose isomerase [Desulfitobacterium hafniense]